MTKARYITKPLADRVAVLRVTRHYPRGQMVTKFRSELAATTWINRQIAEDRANRAAKVVDYLAERAARPAPTPLADPDQLALFA